MYDRLLTKKQLAERLGIAPATIDKWIIYSDVPYLKLGKSRNSPVRFDPADIQRWLRENKEKKPEDYN
jgi:predicted DNA-binding transcriptional regulator AlpA